MTGGKKAVRNRSQAPYVLPSVRTASATLCLGVMTALSACAPQTAQIDAAPSTSGHDRTGDMRVAEVNETTLYRSDVRRAAEAQGLIGSEDELSLDGPIFKTVLDDLIDQRLLALDAVRTGVADTDEAKRRLSAARDRILGNYRVETHLVEVVNDQTVRALYDAQRQLAGNGEERRIRRIVVEDEAVAQDIATRLDEEEDFETLVEAFSIDAPSRDKGGDMGWVSRNMLSGVLAATAFRTPVGGRSAPVQIDETWQIIEVRDVRTPSSRSFEDVREDITRFMTFEAVDALVTDLRDRAEIERVYEAASEDETDSDLDDRSSDTPDAGK